ncbi:NHLP family bacteriocin export ABC transporter peptidase/permease/ATPase [Clostridia bacterium]|nr:NHLP family bacteriocin export ABC transporter peptidase/permease/ATPase [Clostridia bacterium]
MGKIAKVPIIIQLEALECGAACLCMIAAYHKKWIPLTKVREDCGVSRDGSVAKNILNAGRNYGFTASGYKLEPADMGELPLPAIIHWNFNHFVVLCGVDEKKQRVIINDPSNGKKAVTMEEFDKAFTGIALTFEPSEKFKPEGKPKSVLEFAKKCLKGTLMPFILAAIISIVLEVSTVTKSFFDKIFIDSILSGQNTEWLVPFLGVILVVLLIQILVGIIQAIYWQKIQGKFAISSSAEFMWHVLRLPLRFFSQRYIGDIVERQNTTATVAFTLIKKIAPLGISIVSMFMNLAIMINYNLGLTLIGFSASIINIFIVRFISKKLRDYQRASIPNNGKLMSITYSGIDMIETIKSTGAENGYFERWAAYYTKQNNAGIQISNFSQYVGVIPGFIEQLSNIILQMTGIYLIMRGHFTIGMLTAFQGFLAKALSPINMLLRIYQDFIKMRTDMERIEDVLDYPIDVKALETTAVKSSDNKKLAGNIEIKNLTFGYSKLAPPLIEDFSLSLKPGSWVALVGGSGSGKSTVSKLLIGLYQPWKGEILFDGQPKTNIDKYKFHGSVSMVDQEKIIFHDTIKNNLKMWDESIEDFAIIMAARDAEIHHSILTKPEGYNHVFSAGGKDFSGGQCQRIEIARVLAQEPTILILDEATSALDAKTEQTVVENIKKTGCTCVVVAHRLSTVRDCDEIIVLDRGKVVERGTHDVLMKNGNKYSQLITTE